MKWRFNLFRRPGLATIPLTTLVFLGCGATIASFSAQSIDYAVDLKAEALELMDVATADFTDHAEAVNQLRQRMDAALTLESERSSNSITTMQWELMNDPNRDLLGGFLSFWEQRGTLSLPFIAAKKEQVGDGFDMIIDLESAKNRGRSGASVVGVCGGQPWDWRNNLRTSAEATPDTIRARINAVLVDVFRSASPAFFICSDAAPDLLNMVDSAVVEIHRATNQSFAIARAVESAGQLADALVASGQSTSPGRVIVRRGGFADFFRSLCPIYPFCED